SVQFTFNEEINPATFTPAQVTLTGPAGTISGVTVSAVTGSNNHQLVIAFPTQQRGATYTLTVGPPIPNWNRNSMDHNRNGINGEPADAYVMTIGSSPTPTPAPTPTPTATLVKRDATTLGNWIGNYGSQGYNIIGNAVSYPSYATVTASGQSTFT